MDWRRGMLRLWIVLSILWIGTVSWAERDLWQTQPGLVQVASSIMATYSIKAPDGHTYQIDGPEGASDDDVRAHVLAQYPSAGGAPAASEWDQFPLAKPAVPQGQRTKIIKAKGPREKSFELEFPVETTDEVIKNAIAELSRQQYPPPPLLPVLREAFLPPMWRSWFLALPLGG